MSTNPQFKPPKTFAEFEVFRKDLFSARFKAKSMEPISVGLERCRFEAEQLRALIQAAEGVEGVTIKKRIPGWQQKIRRVEENKKRFQRLYDDGKNSGFWTVEPSRQAKTRPSEQAGTGDFNMAQHSQ